MVEVEEESEEHQEDMAEEDEGDSLPEKIGDSSETRRGPDPYALLADGKTQKEEGQEAYSAGDYEKAIDRWCMARGAMKHIVEREFFKEYPDGEERIEETRNLETKLWGNLSQAYLNNKEFYQAINFSNQVLEREPQNVKALYRKASAQIMGSLFKEAKSTIGDLLKLEPTNSAAKQRLIDLARLEAASKVSGKRIAKMMFAGMDHDPRTVEADLFPLRSRICGWLSCCRRRKLD